MTTPSLDKTAEFLYMQIKSGVGSPPQYGPWKDVFDAKVESIVDNMNATPSEATFWFPNARWDENNDISHGDKIRILYSDDIVVFEGFITKKLRQFSGGNEEGGKYERLAYSCLDYRWLMAVMKPCYGQIARSQDDYLAFGTADQAPIPDFSTHFNGCRCIFNADGLPNKDPDELELLVLPGEDPDAGFSVPVFGYDIYRDNYWLAADMIRYILSPKNNLADKYVAIGDPALITGLKHDDWKQQLNDISIEGLRIPEALQFICKRIGWAFRLCFDSGEPKFEFFKPGSGMQHSLFAPAPSTKKETSETSMIKAAVEADKKLLWAAQFDEDITAVVNQPLYYGSKQRVEFTAELVPGWLDSDLVPDTANNNVNLFFYEEDLANEENPNQYDVYKNYHSAGNSFKGDVGRIWVLNVSGIYSDTETYDRGLPFDWGTVLPAKIGFDVTGRRTFKPCARQLLPCLTRDNFTNNPIGIKVEFSFNEGLSWHELPVSITALGGQCGIIITEPNLAEIKPKGDLEVTLAPALAGVDLNYWTSLCGDKLEDRSFKLDEWFTRVRVTASVELDQRVGGQLEPLQSGSPFNQSDLFNFSGVYFHNERDTSSIFTKSNFPVDEQKDSGEFKAYMEKLRDVMQCSSVSGQFILEQLWLNTFKIGESISKIEGRDFVLREQIGSQTMAPEIVQIIYLVQKQQTKLITRDLRFSEKR